MKKVIAVLLVLCIVFSLNFITASAEDRELPITGWTYGETYASGKYFKQLVEAMAGSAGLSPVKRLLKIALSQEGYKSCGYKVSDGGTLSGDHNMELVKDGHTYNEYSNQIGGYGSAWCGAFVSWCLRAAGIPTSVAKTSTVAKHTYWGDSSHLVRIWSDDFKTFKNPQPKEGDLIFYTPRHTKDANCCKHFDSLKTDSHVGIISDVRASGTTWEIRTIERSGNEVKHTGWLKLDSTRGTSGTCKHTTPQINTTTYTNYNLQNGTNAHVFSWIYRPDYSNVAVWTSSDVAKLNPYLSAGVNWRSSYASYIAPESGTVRFYGTCDLTAYTISSITEAGLVIDGKTMWKKTGTDAQALVNNNRLTCSGTQVQFASVKPGYHTYYFYISYNGKTYRSDAPKSDGTELYSGFIMPSPSSQRAGQGYYVPTKSYNLRNGCYEDNAVSIGQSTVVGSRHTVYGGYYNGGSSLWYYMRCGDSTYGDSGWAYERGYGSYTGFTAKVKRVNNNNICPLYTKPLNTKAGTATSGAAMNYNTTVQVVGEAYNNNGRLWYQIIPNNSTAKYWVWADYLLDPDDKCDVRVVNGITVYAQNDPEAGVYLDNVKIEKITLNADKVNLYPNKGNTVQLEALEIIPALATNKKLNWTSSSSDVAEVSSTGLVTAHKPGTATITATAADGSNVSATCEILVYSRDYSIALNRHELVLSAGDYCNGLIEYLQYPLEAGFAPLTVYSTNTDVMDIDDSYEGSGMVKLIAVEAGTADIVFSSSEGAATCTVTVINDPVTAIVPQDTITIESESFDGTAFTAVEIPEGCQTIGERAFADNTNLRFVTLPNSLTYIAPNAFDKSQVTFYYNGGSDCINAFLGNDEQRVQNGISYFDYQLNSSIFEDEE